MNSSFLARDVLTGRDPELSPQSATLWALAWSDEPESLAEPVPYTGGDDAAPQSGQTRYRLPVLLFGIAAGAAAIAVGGLALTLSGTETQPSPAVTTEAVQIAVTPGEGPTGDDARAGGAPQSFLPVTVGSPAAATVTRVTNVPQRVINSSKPSVAAGPASTPPVGVPQDFGTAPAPAAPAPEAPAPAPAAPAPAAPAPAPVTTPAAPPPPAAPPVSTPPIVSIPEVTPMPMPHPVVPPTFDVSSVPVAPNHGVVPPVLDFTPAPLSPKPGIVLPPVLHNPVAPAAANPVITLPTDVTLTPLVPNLP